MDHIGSPGSGTKPAMPDWFQPGASQRPADSANTRPTRPAAGDGPGAAQQPSAGGQPPTAQQPIAGGQPPTAQQPIAGRQPPTAQQPIAGGQPPTVQPPIAGGQPPTVQPPIAGGQPPTVQPPIAGEQPPARQPPTAGGQPPNVQPPIAGVDPPAVQPPVAHPPGEVAPPIAHPPYHPWYPTHPSHPIYYPDHWWKWATATAITGWVVYRWSNPIYYGYGSDGNVIYQQDGVYVNGNLVGTQEDYYRSANDLAEAIPDMGEEEANQLEWLPLGVFALTKKGVNATNMYLQLALGKNGIVAGTFYNETTGVTHPLEGMVDEKTQRIAWKAADGTNPELVMEAGVYNLSNDEAEVLVHFGPDKSDVALLVRLQDSKIPATAQQ